VDVTLGTQTYRVSATARGSQWLAQALRAESGERFGVDVVAPTELEALDRLVHWLEWQFEHAQALDGLQQAERAYHRAMADAAFAVSVDQTGAGGGKASLATLDAARSHLDAVRGRRPSV